MVNPDRGDKLYNIRREPLEQENLIGQEPDIERELRKLAEMHLRKRYGRRKVKSWNRKTEEVEDLTNLLLLH